MSKPETSADEYEDHCIHIAREHHGVLAGWVVVGLLAAAIVFGNPRPGSMLGEGAKLVSVGAAFSQGEEGTLAAQIGLIPKPKD
jgi:hypothetical protein